MRISSTGLTRLLWGLWVITTACATPRPDSIQQQHEAKKYDNLKQAVDDLSEEVRALRTQSDAQSGRLGALTQEVVTAMSKLSRLRAKLERREGEVKKDKEKLEDLKSYGLKAGERSSDRRWKVKELELSIAKQEGEIQGMAEALDEAEAGLNKIQERISENKAP